MRIQNKRILTSIVFVFLNTACFAVQEVPPPGPPPGPGLPIDGGVFVGALFALFYGVKRIIKNNN